MMSSVAEFERVIAQVSLGTGSAVEPEIRQENPPDHDAPERAQVANAARIGDTCSA